ncbi:MAG: LexA family protein [Gemmatimonadaceae bacterium]
MVEESGATVKRYYRERDGRVRLQPANATMAPIYVQESQVRVQGIVVGVLRRY